MSIKSLTSRFTATIKRQVVTNGNSMGGSKSYTTAQRTTDGLRTTCPVGYEPLDARDRSQFGMTDQEVTHYVYASEDPQVDERDQIIVDGKTLFVKGVMNEQGRNRLWQIDCSEFTSGYRE